MWEASEEQAALLGAKAVRASQSSRLRGVA